MIAREVKCLLEAIGQALTNLSGEVEDLGAALCTDGTVIARFTTELQALDRISQRQRALAALLRADCPVRALSEIVLEDLASELDARRGETASDLEDFTT